MAGQSYGRDFGNNLQLSPAQLAVVNAIIKTGKSMGASQRDIMIALLTSYTESGYMTSAVGDGGLAIGPFQQHPSWGSTKSRTDPASSAKAFYGELFKVRNRDKMQPWTVAQAVQRSATADGSNYETNMGIATTVSSGMGIVVSQAGGPTRGSVSAVHGSPTSGTTDFSGEQKVPTLDPQTLAEDYGFSWAFLKQHKDLWGKFQTAVSQGWAPEKFAAEIRGTKWWQQTQASIRQYQMLTTNDPATLKANRAALKAQLMDSAAKMGAVLSDRQMNRVVENALMFGWNSAQLQNTVADYVKARNGIYGGQAGTDAEALKQTAYRNGIRISDKALQSWVSSMEHGDQTSDYYNQYIRKLAKTVAPSYANELDSGMDLYDIASPYMQSKASILQLDPTSVDLFDPDIRAALSGKDPQGKPTSKTLWQFENEMRQKPEYMKTDTARNSAYTIAHQVLNDFGFMGN